jgi:hypothetical protein
MSKIPSFFRNKTDGKILTVQEKEDLSWSEKSFRYFFHFLSKLESGPLRKGPSLFFLGVFNQAFRAIFPLLSIQFPPFFTFRQSWK